MIASIRKKRISPSLAAALAAVALFALVLTGCSGSQPTSGGAANAPASGAGAATSQDAPITGPETHGEAAVTGGVQKIAVDVSSGTYNPNVIALKSGIPAEITFSNGPGCTAQVQSKSLGFSADMSQGPATVKIPAQQPGTYAFACAMEMVHGRIVVR